MIQRIQSIYLVLILILSGVYLFLPFCTPLIVLGINDIAEGVIAITTLIVIFLYKNRMLQIRLLKISYLLLLFVVARNIYIYSVETGFPVDVYFTGIIGVFQLLLNYLAIRAIKKDEELVRSADRIR